MPGHHRRYHGDALLVASLAGQAGIGPGAGKKSLAYRLTYQAPDRTLTDAEAAKIRERIVKRLKEEVGAGLRG
jgi:phenylalanyl-tRNA synthetase beta subunit